MQYLLTDLTSLKWVPDIRFYVGEGYCIGLFSRRRGHRAALTEVDQRSSEPEVLKTSEYLSAIKVHGA